MSWFKRVLPIALTIIAVAAVSVLNPLIGSATIKSLYTSVGGLFKAFGKALLLNGAVVGGLYAVNHFLQPKQGNVLPNVSAREDLKRVIKSTELPARYVFGETRLNPLLVNVGRASAIVGTKLEEIGVTFDEIAENLLRQDPNATGLNRLVQATNVTATFAIANHPCEAITGLTIAGIEAFENNINLTGKGSRDFSISRDVGNRTFTADGRLHWNLTGDGVQLAEIANENLTVIYNDVRTFIPGGFEEAHLPVDDQVIYWGRYTAIYTYTDADGNEQTVDYTSRRRGGRDTFREERYHFGETPVELQQDAVLSETTYNLSGGLYSSDTATGNGLSYFILEFIIPANQTGNEFERQTNFWLNEGGIPQNIEMTLKGVNNIKVPTSSRTQVGLEWNDNPVGITRWIYENLTPYEENEIFYPAWKEAYEICEARGYKANGFLSTDNLEGALRQIATQFRGSTGFDGQLKFYAGEPTADKGIELNKSDMIRVDSITLFEENFNNRVRANFRDVNEGYQLNSTGQITPAWRNPEANNYTLDLGTLEWVNDAEDAEKTARYLLNVPHYGIQSTIELGAINRQKLGNLRQFDLVNINFPEKPVLHGRRFQVSGFTINPDGTMSMGLQHYPNDIFEGVL